MKKKMTIYAVRDAKNATIYITGTSMWGAMELARLMGAALPVMVRKAFPCEKSSLARGGEHGAIAEAASRRSVADLQVRRCALL